MAQKKVLHDAVGAIFPQHRDAEAAVQKFAWNGFDMTHFSIVAHGPASEMVHAKAIF